MMCQGSVEFITNKSPKNTEFLSQTWHMLCGISNPYWNAAISMPWKIKLRQERHQGAR